MGDLNVAFGNPYLLDQKPQPTHEDINAAMSRNLCRCGAYTRIRAAILKAANGPVRATQTASTRGAAE